MIAPGTLRLGHVAVLCRDIAVTARFYEVLGFTAGFSRTDAEGRMELQQMNGPAGFVELICSTADNSAPDSHLGLATDDLEPVVEALAKKGIMPMGPVRRGASGVDYVFFQDPHGNLVEITAPVR